jgi:hypothetical protein
MQLITNADRNNYGTLIKGYDRESLDKINKYPNDNTGRLQSAEGMEQTREARTEISIQGWSVMQCCGRRQWGSSRQ